MDEFDIIQNGLSPFGFSFKRENGHLFLLQGRDILVIFQKNLKNNSISMHLRASILPNHAAIVTSVVFSTVKSIRIGDNFEFGVNNAWLFGDKALEYAAENMEIMWLGRGATKKQKERLVSQAVEEAKQFKKEEFN